MIRNHSVKIGFLVEEFFDEKFRGFGGYGMTVKYIAEHFNVANSKLKADVILMYPLDIASPQQSSAHNADVVMMPKRMPDTGKDFRNYARLIHEKRPDVFIAVDHFQSYEYPLMAFPNIPWVIWLKDPRDEVKFRKYATVSLQLKAWGYEGPDEVVERSHRTLNSFRLVLKRSRMFGRKVCFAAESKDFIPIGKRLYGLKDLNPAILSKPIPLPKMEGPEYAEKPLFLFMARLDPVKRPWIFCELAKRFKDADFVVAGKVNNPEIMEEVLAKYKDVPNLKFLGGVFGVEKDALFRRIWALVNTSVHEGLPVTMVEAFSYGKTSIASGNLDGIAERFGFYTGEMTGDGYDSATLDRYSEPIEKIINGQLDRESLFREARRYVQEVHSFEKFEQTVRDIVSTNRYDGNFTLEDK
ncbi:MAG: glycosyltransferase family 4 protein [Candidatus Omnitrophota bacterium]|nr:glycosyltransferase family 4 protein [Candidatus Omnitrophota bacterium]